MKNILKTIAIVVITILVIDFACLMAWIYSGQAPQDDFFAGAISYNIINLIK